MVARCLHSIADVTDSDLTMCAVVPGHIADAYSRVCHSFDQLVRRHNDEIVDSLRVAAAATSTTTTILVGQDAKLHVDAVVDKGAVETTPGYARLCSICSCDGHAGREVNRVVGAASRSRHGPADKEVSQLGQDLCFSLSAVYDPLLGRVPV